MPETFKQVDPSSYPFRKIIESIFESESLETLHIDENLDDFIKADLGKDSHSKFHKLFYEEIKKPNSELQKCWDKFCINEIKPMFIKDGEIIMQALPNIRRHVPGAQAVKRWHCDSDENHRHPLGELNIILAITNMSGNNSVWRESSPGKGDYKPFEMNANEFVIWDGNKCNHGNQINDTDLTRISFDFRVISHEAYSNYINSDSVENHSATSSSKFSIGSYYAAI